MPPDPAGRDFAEFYAARFHGLAVALYAYTGDLAAAQDLVQEAFCRAYPRWSRLAAYDDPAAWVRRVAWNLAVSRWRRIRRELAAVGTWRPPVVDGPGPDRVALVAALAKLPPKHRRAVVLFHLVDLSVADIATQEGVNEGTVRVWLHRGRAALSAHLDDTTGDSHA
ncbi:MAG TPA: SigE family RNA polymerase sigma factor [Micromonosporaceae bacterium]|nr:SigE family RNA polymerase sigma factor [Micromonosporaceae bacterium]